MSHIDPPLKNPARASACAHLPVRKRTSFAKAKVNTF